MANDLDSLGTVCAAHLLDTKWLLAPSHRVGHQWIESLVRRGQAVVNLHPTTLLRLGLDLIGSELAVEKLTLASGELGPLIVEAAWNQLQPEGYFGRLESTAELSAAVFDSLLSLRLAECSANSLNATNLESSAKGADLCQLLSAYEAFLAQHRLVDAADVLRRAIRCLQAKTAAPKPEALLLVPAGFAATGLERRFLEAWPENQRFVIQHPGMCRSANEPASDVALLAHIAEPVPNVEPQHDGSVQFFRAVGEVNEIREVLRRCLAEKIPLDEVEILHTDASTYSELIYGTAKRYFSEADRPDGVPVTFAEGISAGASRPGRAMVAWLQWIAEGYPQRLLVEMLGEGLLNCADDVETSFSQLARLLRPIAIGQNAANYLPKLDEQVKALRKLAATDPKSTDDEPQALAAQERKLKGLVALRKLVAKLLKVSRVVEQETGAALLEAAATFLTDIARSVNELDRYAAESLIEQLKSRQVWLERLGVSFNLGKWLAALPSQTRVMGSGPRPGHLHVAHVGAGGQSGRSRTFVVGLDDRRFPGAALQDPILLDKERASLSAELPTSAGRLRQQIDSLALTLSRLSGRVTLSWPCLDLADDRETFPCAFALSAYRLISGQHGADLATLNLAIGPPVSFAPTAADKALDETERWLWRLSEDDIRGTDQISLVEARFPHLALGSHARREQLLGFGPFNGFVPLAGQDLDPFSEGGPVLSASSLETVGSCPRKFFFRNGLKLNPREELEVDQDRWLSAAQFGLLLHDVFRRFMAELTQAGKLPLFERDHQQLATILRDCVAQWRSDVPPANENAYRVQYWRLVRTAKLFLQAEEQFCQNSQPRYFEVALGMPSEDEGTLLDSEEPICVSLGGGQSIRARGKIDRVDETGAHRFVVWDYKVGSGYGYDPVDPFRQGRRVQSLLYLRMIESALRAKHDPQAAVEGFGYFFPSVRTFGLRVQWDATALAGGASILTKLCSLIREGAFLATNKADDCRFCDYTSICGDGQRLASQSQELLERTDLVSLGHFRELRCG